MPLRPPASSSRPRTYHSAPVLAGPSHGPTGEEGAPFQVRAPVLSLIGINRTTSRQGRWGGCVARARSHFRGLSRAASIASMWS